MQGEGRDTAKGWVRMLPDGQPDKVALARIVDADRGRDEAENTYYECAADPDFVRMEENAEAVPRSVPAPPPSAS